MTLPRTIAAVVLLLVAPGTPAQAWERGHVETFATLPAGTHNPEGITADRHGHIYVTTFDVTKAGGPGDLLVFGGGKQVLAVNPFTGANDDDNLWIAANQADEIVVLNPSGRVVAKLGDFDGINRHGEPIGLLFPARLVRHGHHIYVTNLSLDLRLFGFPAVDAQWAADVQRHTIARIPARIPKVKGLK
jgi:hypothetical protein